MSSKDDLRQVTSNEHGVSIQFVDAKGGVVYTFALTWKKLEALAKKHGVKATLPDTARAVSKYYRDAMESE